MMQRRWAKDFFKSFTASVLATTTAGMVIATIVSPDAEAEGRRWTYGQGCIWGPERYHPPYELMKSRLTEFQERFEKLLDVDKNISGNNIVSCTFLLELDGRISKLKPESTDGTSNLEMEAALIKMVKRTAPAHLPDAVASHGWVVLLTLQNNHPSYRKTGYQ